MGAVVPFQGIPVSDHPSDWHGTDGSGITKSTGFQVNSFQSAPPVPNNVKDVWKT